MTQKEEIFQHFNNRVNNLMKKEGIDGITELAKRSNISQSTLSTIMNKKRLPKIDIIVKISSGLNISVHEFFDFEPFNEDKNTQELNYLISNMSKEQEEILKNLLKTFKTEE